MEQLLSAQQTADALAELYRQIDEHLAGQQGLAVIGIRTRGEVLAQRVVQRLRQAGRTVEHGVLDITFYRDDLSLRKGMPLVRATEIDFELDDKLVLLVDDVLATGRSVRAALDALTDFGRPRAIRLGVLVDRGGRELPIAADFIGASLQVPPDARVQVRLQEQDGLEGVFLVSAKRPRKK